MAPPIESGRFEDLPLPRLLLDLYAERFSGALDVQRQRTTKRITFDEGIPVVAESNLSSESLGVQLLDAARISREDYSKVVSHVQREKCKEGKALLDLGLLEPKELVQQLREQLRRRIVECFAWPGGNFSLDGSHAPPAGTQPFRIDPVLLVQEGIETHWRSDRIMADLTDKLELYALRAEPFAKAVKRLRDSEPLRAFVAALDGTTTLWAALRRAGSEPPLTPAWVLDAMGALAYRETPADPAGDTPAPPERKIEIVFESPGEAAPAAAGSAAMKAAPREAKKDPAAAELRMEVLDTHGRLDELDAYALLGVSRDSKGPAIKRAYVQAAKRYHPDALARIGIDDATRRAANEVFAKIAKAHSVLSNPGKRSEYDASLADQGGEIDANRLALAETNYRKGEILLRKGDFKGAAEFLSAAVDLWPAEAEYQGALGWALYKKLPSEPERARDHLKQAIALDPADAAAHHRLSLVLRTLGDESAAQQAATRAKELDPNGR